MLDLKNLNVNNILVILHERKVKLELDRRSRFMTYYNIGDCYTYNQPEVENFSTSSEEEEEVVNSRPENGSKGVSNDSYLLEQHTLNKEIDSLSADIQRLFFVLVFLKSRSIKQPLYIPHYYDFRGRMYPDSIVGFTYMKIFRSLYSKKPSIEVIIKSSAVLRTKYASIILANRCELPNDLAKHVKDDFDYYFLTILLIEIGKLFKKQLLKTGCSISISDFVNLGAKYLLLDESCLEVLEDKVYYIHIKNCIQHFLTHAE
jgi:hypothetical protein